VVQGARDTLAEELRAGEVVDGDAIEFIILIGKSVVGFLVVSPTLKAGVLKKIPSGTRSTSAGRPRA
jgi:hypothetical protein